MGRKQQSGVGLIEVLVTVLIMATSLLAMGALQSRALQFNHSAYLRSQANVAAYDILDRMRINRINHTNYERDFHDAIPGGNSVAQRDLNEWLSGLQRTLPGGEGSIECDGNRVCSVQLRWVDQDSLGRDLAQGEQEFTTFTYSTRI